MATTDPVDPWAAFRNPPAGQVPAQPSAAAPIDPYAAFRVRQPAPSNAAGLKGAVAAPVDEWAAFRNPPPSASADPYAAYRIPPTDSVPADVAKSAGSGLVRGAAELAMTPATLPKVAADAVMNGGEWLVRKALGLGEVTPATQAARDQAIAATSGGVADPATAVGAVRSGLDATLHVPQTTLGRYAEVVGEFAPSVLAGPGGIMRKAAEAAIPAIVSQAAGDATKGTVAEPYARVAGGLLGNLGAVAPSLYHGAADRIVARAVTGADPAAFSAAQELQARAAAMGVPLSGPEAIQAVTNSATKLGDVQRVVEGSTAGGAQTGQFYAQRPDQVTGAVGRTLDQIAPAPAQPSTLGRRAANAAQGAIDTVRQDINVATRPAYQAAEGHVLEPADFAPIGDNPAFQTSLAGLRAHPVLGPAYLHLPDNSVGVIDAVTKDMADRGVALGNAANPGFNRQAAAAYSSGAADARDIARDPMRGGSQAYDDALTAQEQARRQNLNPLEQGPLGRIAAATDTQGAYGALLPDLPLAGSEGEVAQTAARLADRDPNVLTSLIRQSIADHADVALRRNESGPNQWGGAKLAKAVSGTDQQRANLAAALGAANVQSDLPSLLDVLRATGQRKPQGSATAFNQQIAADLGHQSVHAAAVQAAVTGGIGIPSFLGKISDAARLHALNRNSSSLADLFLAPDSATRLGAIAARGAENPLTQMFGRAALQLPLSGSSAINAGGER